jgi:2-dehydro-3-deoxyphosphogluconate aldolase / (4S)-4-hydroxy-2-oxoglutarate aldolase
MTVAAVPGPIVPVIVVDRADVAPELAAALNDGGVHCAEITLRTPAGLPAIAAMAASAPPGFAVGAGTVLDIDQVERAAGAGATFIVSPGYDPAVVDRARALGLGVLPGVATATEVQRVRRDGLDTVKFFPAHLLGGAAAIAAFAAVFDGIGFVPSGGVGVDDIEPYLRLPAVPAVSGSWLASRTELGRGDMSAVRDRAAVSAERARRAIEGRAGS